MTIYTILFLLICSGTAHAYLDPGTGSYIIQIVIATMVGMLVSIRLFWQTIKSRLAGLFGKKAKRKDDEQK